MAEKGNLDQWQCGKSLPECLGYMLDNEVSSDVTFLVGDRRKTVKAHKTILISRSPVFFAMLNGPMKETENITIPDIERETFKDILKYIYTDKVILTADNAISILYGAKKYCIDTLSKKCTQFLESSLSDENVCVLLEQSHLYAETELHQKCLKHILHSKSCFDLPHFLDLCPTCCESIISHDELAVKEELIYEGVLQWSGAECARRKLEVTNTNRRKVLGNILFAIRFPLIDKHYFAKNILKTNLLSDREKLSVFENHYNVADQKESVFISKNRRQKIKKTFDERLVRFPTKTTTGSWRYGSNKPDTIYFEVSDDVVLHGVLVYGDGKSSTYTINLDILNDQDEKISTVKTQFHTTLYEPLCNILLNIPACIKAKTKYKVVALISGPYSHNGTGGLNILNFQKSTVKFFKTDGPNNGTSVESGQIPGLLLSSV